MAMENMKLYRNELDGFYRATMDIKNLIARKF